MQILMANPNFILLDEPTNDLDIQTLNILEDFLEQYQGCLMVVSHDRYFMDRLVDHLWVFEGDGRLVDFPGNYTDFRESGRQKTVSLPQNKQEVKEEALESNKVKKKLSFAEQKLEETMPIMEEQIRALADKLSTGLGTGRDFEEWSSKYAETKKQLADAELRWLELTELKS